MGIPSREPNIVGNTDLSAFDAVVIGSGAGGSVAAYALATNGKNVLVLEAGDNYFQGLDDPASDTPVPLFSNDDLEPFYTEVEMIAGVQGEDGSDPFAPARSRPYAMPPGVPMYVSLLAAEGARKLGYHPFPYPTAVNSRPYRDRPPCVDCGFCSGYGCPNNAKGSPAVTFLRDALLSEHCQLRYNAQVARLVPNAGKTGVDVVEYIDPEGKRQQVRADIVILAASPIEDARLCLLSDPDGPGLGNSAGLVGRNLMFHAQTIAVGIFPQRLHGHRGRALTHGMSDFRGVPGDPGRPLAGIIEFGAATEVIAEAKQYALLLGNRGAKLKHLMRESPLRDHLMGLTMQAEDAPQTTNRVDLDPAVRDVYRLPVARITYKNHDFELSAREFYTPKLIELLGAAGAQFAFVAPPDTPSGSRHIMGTLRMGDDPRSSVCDRYGKFHDFDNLYCADGALFPTSSGFNPTLTIH